jgi:ABC-2 type transport system permease protein
MRRHLRLVVRAAAVHARIRLVAPLGLVLLLVIPILHASFAVYLFDSGTSETALLYAAIGAGFVGMWTWLVWDSGMAVHQERGGGTLELLVAAPAPLVPVLLGRTLAVAGVGAYNLLATLVWGWLALDVPVDIDSPLAFAAAVVASVVALGCLGLIVASLFVLTRDAQALAGLIDTPPWLLCGLFVPIAVLPEWTRPLSWALAPTFGVDALRGASAGHDVTGELAACLALAVAYVVLAAVVLRAVERRARVQATLGLA